MREMTDKSSLANSPGYKSNFPGSCCGDAARRSVSVEEEAAVRMCVWVGAGVCVWGGKQPLRHADHLPRNIPTETSASAASSRSRNKPPNVQVA